MSFSQWQTRTTHGYPLAADLMCGFLGSPIMTKVSMSDCWQKRASKNSLPGPSHFFNNKLLKGLIPEGAIRRLRSQR
jgi:hypothetical protein